MVRRRPAAARQNQQRRLTGNGRRTCAAGERRSQAAVGAIRFVRPFARGPAVVWRETRRGSTPQQAPRPPPKWAEYGSERSSRRGRKVKAQRPPRSGAKGTRRRRRKISRHPSIRNPPCAVRPCPPTQANQLQFMNPRSAVSRRLPESCHAEGSLQPL